VNFTVLYSPFHFTEGTLISLFCSSPFVVEPYLGSSETSPSGGLGLDSFLSLVRHFCSLLKMPSELCFDLVMSEHIFLFQWTFLCLTDAEACAAHLQYTGQSQQDSSASLRVTRRRKVDRQKGQSARIAIRCLVVGPSGSGKSSLLDSLLKKYHSLPPSHTLSPLLPPFPASCFHELGL
jgi:hypothetical protein